MIYRCPNDDTVFQTWRVDRAPTLQGHPECPGPACRARFGGAAAGSPVVAPPSQPQPQAAFGSPAAAAAAAPAPTRPSPAYVAPVPGPAPVQNGQEWSPEMVKDAAAPGGVGLPAFPAGQDW